jgi:hypothetical protein
MEFNTSLTLFYTKMSFKILNIFQQTISRFLEKSTLVAQSQDTSSVE